MLYFQKNEHAFSKLVFCLVRCKHSVSRGLSKKVNKKKNPGIKKSFHFHYFNLWLASKLNHTESILKVCKIYALHTFSIL